MTDSTLADLLDGLIPRWHAKGACIDADPSLFFPVRGASNKEAKALCAGCAVRSECLDFALAENIHHGVWGGLSDRQRRQLRRDQHAVTTSDGGDR